MNFKDRDTTKSQKAQGNKYRPFNDYYYYLLKISPEG